MSTSRPKLKDVILRLLAVKGRIYATQKGFYEAWSEARRDVYRTREWQLFKLKVIQRSKGVCEGCKSRRATEIHHVIRVYDDPTQIVTLKNVRHVCKECHDLVHHGNKPE